MEQAEDVKTFEAFPALQEIELDRKGQTGDIAAELSNQFDCCFHGAARRQQIVHDHHALPTFDRIQMNLQSIRAIFQIVSDPRSFCGQFFWLSNWNKSGI